MLSTEKKPPGMGLSSAWYTCTLVTALNSLPILAVETTYVLQCNLDPEALLGLQYPHPCSLSEKEVSLIVFLFTFFLPDASCTPYIVGLIPLTVWHLLNSIDLMPPLTFLWVPINASSKLSH